MLGLHNTKIQESIMYTLSFKGSRFVAIAFCNLQTTVMSRRECYRCTLNAKKSTLGPGSESLYAEWYFWMQYVPLIVIHTGAGRYAKTNDARIKALCDQTCRLVMEELKTGLSALSGAEMAVQMLEDSPLTNAGYGSHLNGSGQVECDAAIMSNVDGKFGCVAAVPGT